MRIVRILLHRLRSLLRRSRMDADLQRELDLHFEQLVKEQLAAGHSASDARLAAQRAFGSLESTKEQCRDMRRVHLVEDLIKDLGYAARLLRKSPGFTLTAVASLALGIGANTTIFGIVNAFLLRALPYDHPERLVALFERTVIGGQQVQQMSVAPANFLDWQTQSTTLAQISAYTTGTSTLAGSQADVEAQRIVTCACSGNLFETLGVSFAVGRPFRADEDRNGAPPVVVISDNLWRGQFGADANVVGKTIRIDNQAYQVIGVAPRGFMFPVRTVDVWLPLMTTITPQQQLRHDLHYLQVIGRVRPDRSVEEARADVNAISARYKNAHPQEATGEGATVAPLHSWLVSGVRTPLFILLGVVSCVLLIACVNIANLMLTRASTRTREIGLRTALGASGGRIVRQLVTESVLLALAGGAMGSLLAVQIARALVARAPGANAILPAGDLPIDAAMLLFAFVIALATGIAVGLVPAIRSARADVTDALRDGATRASTPGRSQGHLRDLLVAVEVALSIVLLIAAGLLVRSFSRLYNVHPGIRIDSMITMRTSLSGANYREAVRRSEFWTELGERVRRVPGIDSVGLSSCVPLTGACNVLFYYVEGRPFVPGKFFASFERSVDPGYFATAGIPLQRGRTFTKDDGVGFDPAHPRLGSIVISESMARAIFPGEDPIGKRIYFDFERQREVNERIPAPRYQIIGVVGDVLPALDAKIAPTLYRPLLDTANSGAVILLRTSAESQSVIRAARQQIHELDPTLATFQVKTMEELLGRTTADRRFSMLLFAAFAALAVLLAAIGLYGVVSHAVSQRTAEIGVRMALGARPIDVRRLVLMQGLRPTFAGIAIGLIGAALAARVLRSLLFGVTPADPLTFALVPPLLLAVAALACYLPATRATRLDPTVALRSE